jgi:hypothetical protein
MNIEQVNLDMVTIGPCETVLGNFHRKTQEDLPDITTVLILVGGMQRGVIQAWQCAEFESLGLTSGIDKVMGLSVGSAVGRELTGGTVAVTKNFFHEDSLNEGVILPRSFPPLVDFGPAEKILRQRGATEESVRSSKTELLIHLQDRETGVSSFISAREIDDTVAAVISAMSMPYVTKSPVLPVNGKLYGDPMHINALPIDYAIKKLHATDILVLFTENPFTGDRRLQAFNLFLSHLANLKTSERFSVFSHLRSMRNNIRYLTDPNATPDGINVAGIYPTNMPLNPNERNAHLLEEAGKQAARFAAKIGSSVKTLKPALSY